MTGEVSMQELKELSTKVGQIDLQVHKVQQSLEHSTERLEEVLAGQSELMKANNDLTRQLVVIIAKQEEKDKRLIDVKEHQVRHEEKIQASLVRVHSRMEDIQRKIYLGTGILLAGVWVIEHFLAKP